MIFYHNRNGNPIVDAIVSQLNIYHNYLKKSSGMEWLELVEYRWLWQGKYTKIQNTTNDITFGAAPRPYIF